MFVSFNPQDPTNRRAVCGKTARTVRREGSRKSMRLSYPYLGMFVTAALLRIVPDTIDARFLYNGRR